ncbi:SDR family oxidoreductase [Aliidiomarina sp. Khilg15.8]
MKILLLGGTGLLGQALQHELPGLGEVVAPRRRDLDLSNVEQLHTYLITTRPDLIVNAAALNGETNNESNVEQARLMNVKVPEVLAKFAAQQDIRLVHFSTAQVYHNQAKGLITETTETKPFTAFGKHKLEGDKAIIANCDNHLIFRLTALYDENDICPEKLPAEPVYLGAPTSAQYVAGNVTRSLSRLYRRVLREQPGVYHLAAKGEANWQEFSRELQRQRKSQVIASSIAAAPKFSVEKAEDNFCLFIPSWQAQLQTSLSNSNKLDCSG